MTGAGSSCGACKFLRRKCTSECVFVPYFSYNDAASHFAAVHKVFGASNVSKLLMHIPVHHRTEAAFTISYEALARMTDPVFGCVSHIYNLHQQVSFLHNDSMSLFMFFLLIFRTRKKLNKLFLCVCRLLNCRRK